MKLAIAAFSTALVLATGASAMIGPYERAVDQPDVAGHLFTDGAQDNRASSTSSSPAADWNNGEVKNVTVFSTKGEVDQQKLGADNR